MKIASQNLLAPAVSQAPSQKGGASFETRQIRMLCIRMSSGEPVCTLKLAELTQMAEGADMADHPTRALKLYLQSLCGQPRFRQRLLLQDGTVLNDDAVLDRPAELQLVLLPFSPVQDDEVKELLAAALNNMLPEVEFILYRPQDPDLVLDSEGGETPLHLACSAGHGQVVLLLLEARANQNKCNSSGMTPLLVASTVGDLSIVSLLLEASADHSKTSLRQGATPLHRAAQRGHGDVVRTLLAARANMDHTTPNGTSPLLLACQNGHNSTVKILLEASADTNMAANGGATALLMAVRNGHTTCAQSLVEARAALDTPANDGAAALLMASEFGRVDIVHLLLQARASMEQVDHDGATALFMACLQGHPAVVKMLLDANADHEKLCAGSTSLQAAAEKGDPDVVYLLLKARADLNVEDEDGNTALSWACARKKANVIHLLQLAAAQQDAKRARHS